MIEFAKQGLRNNNFIDDYLFYLNLNKEYVKEYLEESKELAKKYGYLGKEYLKESFDDLNPWSEKNKKLILKEEQIKEDFLDELKKRTQQQERSKRFEKLRLEHLKKREEAQKNEQETYENILRNVLHAEYDKVSENIKNRKR